MYLVLYYVLLLVLLFSNEYILHYLLLFLSNLIIMNRKIKNIIVFFGTTMMAITVFFRLFRYFYCFAWNCHDYLQTVLKSNIIFSLFDSGMNDDTAMQ